MAGDWIKMRVNLVEHPKVRAIAEQLAANGKYQDWSTMAGFAPAIGGTEQDYEDDFQASLRVTRYVTVCALLRFWGYANEHAKDEFIGTLRVQDLDDITQVPGFGEALALVGWVAYNKERKGIDLPGFNEYNTSGSERGANAKTNAQRQKEYRDRKKEQEDQQESNVTRDVTRNRREEKNREEKKEDKGAAAPAEFCLPDWIPKDSWGGYVGMRNKLKKPMTDHARDLVIRQLERFRSAGHSVGEILDTSTRSNWVDVYEPKPKPGATSPTVPGPSGPDPALEKIKADSLRAVPPPGPVREALRELSTKFKGAMQ